MDDNSGCKGRNKVHFGKHSWIRFWGKIHKLFGVKDKADNSKVVWNLRDMGNS